MVPPSVCKSPDLFAIEDSEWPILVVHLPAQSPIEEHRAHLAKITNAAAARREPFVLLIDTTSQVERPDALHRSVTAEAMTSFTTSYPGLMRGLAVVLRSKHERGVLTALDWLARPPYPLTSFDKMAEAKAWASCQLRETVHQTD